MNSDSRRTRARWRTVGLIVSLVAGLGGSALLAGVAGGQTSGYTDLVGTYSGGVCTSGTLAQCEASPQYPHTLTIATEDFSTGAITGGLGQGEPMTGQITGCTVTMHFAYGGYTSDATETISADATKLEGTFSDSYGRVNQPSFDVRTSGGPATCPPSTTTTTTTTATPTTTTPTTTTTTTTAGGQHPSATQIICNYDFASSADTCGASVGDADTSGGMPIRPTGTVTFTGPANGAFASGSRCTLTAQAAAPSIGFCTIVFYAPDGSLPTITGTYGGDAQHAGSSGHTQFLGGDPSGLTTDTTGRAANGQYPNEVDLSTTVPTPGTTVEACATSASATATAAAVPALVRPHGLTGDLGSIGQMISSDTASTKALGDALQKIDLEAPGQQGSSLSQMFAQNANSQLSKSLADLAAAQIQLNSGTLGPTELSQLQGEVKEQQRRLELVDMLLQRINANMCGISNFTAHNVRAVGAVSARAKRAKSKHLIVLSSTVRRGVGAGPLKIRLHLTRSKLLRVMHGRSSAKLYLRLALIEPSKLFPNGRTVIVVKRLTLHRAKKHHR